MTETYEIEKVKFGRKTVDQGVILGRRPWKWTLGRKYSPCHAKDVNQKCNISALSPHKSNFFIYIPAAFLEVGQVIRIVNKEYKQERIEKTVKVLTVTPQYIETELIEEKHHEEEENASEGDLTQEYAWNSRSASSADYIDDPESLNFDTFEVRDNEFEDLQDVIETETPNTKHQAQGVYIMNTKQTGFSFIYATSAKLQSNMFAGNTQEERQEEPVDEPFMFDMNQYTREPEREVLTLTEPEKEEPKPPKIDRMQYGMFTPVPDHRERKNQIGDLPIFQAKEEKPIEEKTVKTQEETVKGYSPQEIAVLTALLHDKPKHIDDLHNETRMPIGLLSATLLMLEMSNKVTQKAGKMFVKV